MNNIIFVVVYLMLVLIHIGIFYSKNVSKLGSRDNKEFQYIKLGIVFPLFWIIFIIVKFFSIPIMIVDYLEKRKKKKDE